jgi:6-pyruvoyltetrahydropterin/6-carboxytetrahydropterin synthase
MTRVTRRYRFAASHRLDSATFSAEENRALYGKCNNPYGHGHDYVLEVSVVGPIDVRFGQVVNIGALDRLVHGQILNDFDHRYLNVDVPEFQALVPTSENILRVIEDRLGESWPREWPRLDAIRLRETARNAFELKVS